jgi:Ras-related protein Rab-5C
MNNDNKPVYTHKLVFLGGSCVGKSSILLRYIKNKFNPQECSTIGASFLTSKIILDDCIIKFEIWDTAGQERYHSLAPLYYRNASVIFVTFDVTCYTSYAQAKSWITELKQSGPEKAIIVLVGNKVDITDLTKFKSEIVNEYATENNIKYIETSAKTNYNIEKLFKDAALSVPTRDKSTVNNIKVGGDDTHRRNSYCCYYVT